MVLALATDAGHSSAANIAIEISALVSDNEPGAMNRAIRTLYSSLVRPCATTLVSEYPPATSTRFTCHSSSTPGYGPTREP